MTRGAARGGLLRASLFLGVLGGLLLACGKPATSPATNAPTLEVEYKGCWAFYLPGQVCALQQTPYHLLNLWIKTTPANLRVEIRADGRLLTVSCKEVQGGRNCRPDIPQNAGLLSVRAVPPQGGRGAGWSLRLKEAEQPWTNRFLLYSKDPGSKEQIEDFLKSTPPEEKGFVYSLLALKAEGNQSEEEKWLLEGRAADQLEQRWSGVIEKTSRLAGLYINIGRFSDARRSLEDLKFPPNPPAEARYFVAFDRGLLAQAAGDYTSALEQVRQAQELAERLNVTKYLADAEQVQGLIFEDLGRSENAAQKFDGLLGSLKEIEKDHCEAGVILGNAGWFWMMEHEAGKDSKNPIPILEQARAEFIKGNCPSEQLNAHLNMALAYQQKGMWHRARQELGHAKASTEPARLADLLWKSDLEARAEIQAGHPQKALHLYVELEKKSTLAASPAGVLRALLGQAQALRGLGLRKKEIETLAKADGKIEEQSLHIPVHEGRDTFFAYQEAVTRRYLELLLEERQKNAAFMLARRSYSRLLRQLEVRDRLSQLSDEDQKKWLRLLSSYRVLRNKVESLAANRLQLAVSEKDSALEYEAKNLEEARKALDGALSSLPAPAEGSLLRSPEASEVILAYHPLSDGKWVGFAATLLNGIEAKIFRMPAPLPTAPEALVRILLKPFQSAIDASESIRILPYGPLRFVDFHALPFDGDKPLLETHLVSYSLDLPVGSPAPRVSGGQREALVVSNPTSDLRTADDEAEMVVAAIRQWPAGWKPVPLHRRDAKSRTVLKELRGSSFFHYAGHGAFRGFAGWDSELQLADSSRLTLGDVLALKPAPDWIVLSACDAARTSREAPGEGIGLANAFLLAGSKGVVAARTSVPDLSAKELMTALYSKWRSGEDLPSQFRRAQLECRVRNPSPDAAWASFRLLVP